MKKKIKSNNIIRQSLVCPTLAVDNLALPDHILTGIVGGSASFAAIGSSLFAPTILSGIIGRDFPKSFIKELEKRKINSDHLQKSKKRSFHWDAKYSEDLHKVTTIKNEMNAFADYKTTGLKTLSKNCFAAFISNIDPKLQIKILKSLPKKTIKILDSMDLWMIERLPELKKAMKLVDVFMVSETEANLLVEGNPPVPELIDKIMRMGPKVVIYKRGEYGLTMYGKMGTIIVPSYPFTFALDPTGAGDVLGGAIAGVLTSLGHFDRSSMTTAVLLGNIAASFAVEDYGIEGILNASYNGVINRANIFLDQLPNKDNLQLEIKDR